MSSQTVRLEHLAGTSEEADGATHSTSTSSSDRTLSNSLSDTQFNWVKNIISKIKYKPNFSFELMSMSTPPRLDSYMFPYTFFLCVDVIDMPDADRADHVTRLRGQYKIESFSRSEDDIILQVQHIFHQMEIHESDEWFRYQGVKMFDPHKHEKLYTQPQEPPLTYPSGNPSNYASYSNSYSSQDEFYKLALYKRIIDAGNLVFNTFPRQPPREPEPVDGAPF